MGLPVAIDVRCDALVYLESRFRSKKKAPFSAVCIIELINLIYNSTYRLVYVV